MPRTQSAIYVRTTPEFLAEFEVWAARLGLSKSQLGSLCLRAGLNHIVQAVSPLDALRPGQLRQLLGDEFVKELLAQQGGQQ